MYDRFYDKREVDVDGMNRFETRAKRRGERGSRRVNLNREAGFEEVNWEDNQERYNEMITDAFGMGNTDDEGEEEPNPEAARFYELLEFASKPLINSCVHSKLSICV
ncbi:hypothetical protein PIB30_029630 [Stylosanthes scabra]|uniref:Uncharacterized protein n=1 Tax=Stylosanthes scabra TaxID=79078 RepID=A0ABU6RBL0_9FABA|nr:hypothetical protein [Stylosanthes scabra]